MNDREFAAWEAEAPQREQAQRDMEAQAAEMERQRLENEAHIASIKYENRFILFIDILGWAGQIDASAQDENLARDLGRVHFNLSHYATHQQNVRQLMPECPSDQRITQFSDTIVLSCAPDRHGLDEIVASLWFLSTSFLRLGILFRGHITAGLLYHTDTAIFGPALNAAYGGEKAAIYPRVTLDKTIAEQVGQGDQFFDPRTNAISFKKTWRRDIYDGQVFYDFLQPMLAWTDDRFSEYPDPMHKAMMDEVYALILKNLERFRFDDHIHSKYRWLGSYYDCIVDEYPKRGYRRINQRPTD